MKLTDFKIYISNRQYRSMTSAEFAVAIKETLKKEIR